MPSVEELRQSMYQKKRGDLQQQARASQQQADDAITRRFASLGQAGSGAALGAQMKAREGIQANANSAMNDLATQEVESQLQRQFATEQADKDMVFKRGLFDIEQGNKLKELDLAQKQYELERDAQEFNKRMAEIEAGREDAGLLGSGGLLGTGIGGEKGFLGTGIASKGRGGLVGAAGGGLAAGAINPALAPLGAISGGGGCFLTTACVQTMGMADDCWVLETARKFRDTYMVGTPERARDIMNYYAMAPIIVEKINARDDSKKVWKSLFWKHIVPFVDAAKQNENDKAYKLYLEMIERAKELGG